MCGSQDVASERDSRSVRFTERTTIQFPKPIVGVVLLTTLRSADSSTAGSTQSSTVVTIEVARATGVYDMVREDRSSYSVWRARVQ